MDTCERHFLNPADMLPIIFDLFINLYHCTVSLMYILFFNTIMAEVLLFLSTTIAKCSRRTVSAKTPGNGPKCAKKHARSIRSDGSLTFGRVDNNRDELDGRHWFYYRFCVLDRNSEYFCIFFHSCVWITEWWLFFGVLIIRATDR